MALSNSTVYKRENIKWTRWSREKGRTYNYGPGWFFIRNDGHPAGPYSSEEAARNAEEDEYMKMMAMKYYDELKELKKLFGEI